MRDRLNEKGEGRSDGGNDVFERVVSKNAHERVEGPQAKTNHDLGLDDIDAPRWYSTSGL
jgi:hypothetical protein